LTLAPAAAATADAAILNTHLKDQLYALDLSQCLVPSVANTEHNQ